MVIKMNISKIIVAIYEGLLQLVPLFRVIWAATLVLGISMLMIAFIMKKNPARIKSPWIVGGFGLLMVISSGTQLIMSIFRT